MTSLNQAKLVLFFTQDTSLQTWAASGTLQRETALYRALLGHVGQVDFVTYGRRADLALARKLERFGLHCNRWGLPPRLYRSMRARGWGLKPKGPAVFKSNQVPGAEIGLKAAESLGVSFIARAGYLPSNIFTWRHGPHSAQAEQMKALEQKVFSQADRVVVTTAEMAETVSDRYGVDSARVRVIPNFVNTEAFGLSGQPRRKNLLVYVGRLHPEKNVKNLVEATEGLDVTLLMIGEGHLRPRLEALCAEKKLPVQFLGKVANAELPQYLNQAGLFILPSRGEHHPKALLEAMACGVPVLGANVPGVRQLISQDETGLLCGITVPEIKMAIQDALSRDPEDMAEMARKARLYLEEHFSFPAVLALEVALLEDILG
jgi:glycosyltransferase involved in cell wall biosynthesis